MKYLIDAPVLAFTGNTFKVSPDSEEPQTLKDMLVEACLTANPSTYSTGEKKLRIFRIMNKIYLAEKSVDLVAEEVSLLKELVGERFNVAAVGALYEILDNQSVEKQS